MTRVMSDVLAQPTVTPDEEAAYQLWVTKNPLMYGRTGRTAFLAGRRSVKPNWAALSTAEKLAHMEGCWSCEMCADGRAFGMCTSCRKDPVEALPPYGESRCCGSHVHLGSAA